MTLTQTGRHASRTVNLGRALLPCDKSPEDPGWTTKEICEALGICDRTVERSKKRFVEDGMEQALERWPVGFGVRPFKFDGAIKANLIAMACGEPPEGRARWTVRLLAREGRRAPCHRLDFAIVRVQDSKKNEFKPHWTKYWKIQPENSVEFVTFMEDVLDTYGRPYDPLVPVVCMDWVQLATGR